MNNTYDNDYRILQAQRIASTYGIGGKSNDADQKREIVKSNDGEFPAEENIKKSEAFSALESIFNEDINKSIEGTPNLKNDQEVSEKTAPETGKEGGDDGESEDKEVEEKKKIKKSVDEILPELIMKGEITDKIAFGYGSTNEPFKFEKTGKVIKEKLPSIITVLSTEMANIEGQMNAIKQQIGVDPTVVYDSKYSNSSFNRYTWDMCEAPYNDVLKKREEPTDQNTLCNKYNTLCSLYQSVSDDIATSQVLLSNIEDNKKYNLSVNQLVALGFVDAPIQKSRDTNSFGTPDFVKSRRERILSAYSK